MTMETNPSQYNKLNYTGQQQKDLKQSPKKPAAMPKARTLALAHTLKKWLTVASLVGFGTFSGLIAYHQLGSATTTSGTSQTTTATPTATQNSNNFFQQGGNNIGTTTATPTPTSTSTTSSAPVSGTSASASH